MKHIASLPRTGLVVLSAALCWTTGCSSLRVVQGSPNPPPWLTEPSAAADYQADRFVYASGMATYCLTLEEGIQDARHDAIRKLVERIGVAADNVYRTDRMKQETRSQSGMPNMPQMLLNSRRAVKDISGRVNDKATTAPQAFHVSRSRVHGIEEQALQYTVWRYRPSLLARWLDGDTAIRFYDVYVLLRCPVEEFNAAIELDRRLESLPETLQIKKD